jgi:uncharacterized protein (TIGR03067 family)
LQRERARAPGTIVPIKTDPAKLVDNLSQLMGGRFAPALEAQPDSIVVRAGAETTAEIREVIRELDIAPIADGSDYAKLQGTWKVVAVEFGGKEAPVVERLKDFRWTFLGRERMLLTNMTAQWAKYSLDGAKKPKEINFKFASGPTKDRSQLGIYEIDGDRLKICWTDQPEGARPPEFSSRSGVNSKLVVLERVRR